MTNEAPLANSVADARCGVFVGRAGIPEIAQSLPPAISKADRARDQGRTSSLAVWRKVRTVLANGIPFPFSKVRVKSRRWAMPALYADGHVRPDMRVDAAFLSSLSRQRSLFMRALNNEALALRSLPDIDISIVTHNSEQWLDDFLASLEETVYPKARLNLMFRDHESTDASVARLERFRTERGHVYRTISIDQRENSGFGCGHHLNIVRGEAPFILVVNVDMEFEPHALLSAVTMAITDRLDVGKWEFRQKPFEHPKYYDPVTLETAWCSHTCVLMRRSAYLETGGYEPKIFMYGEDVELSFRFRDHGWRLRYWPHSVVWHYTYKFANEIKPLQFQCSTLTNALLRIRYGSFWSIMAIVRLYIKQYAVPSLPEGRRILTMNLAAIFALSTYFVLTRHRSGRFPFFDWDYELRRDGAFYAYPPSHMTEAEALRDGPLVSVIIRTQSGRVDLLRQALLSVGHQTYHAVEAVVVEDGGDATQKMCETMAQQGLINVQYLSIAKSGRSVAGNRGLAAARGTYFLFLDDDDALFPDHVEVLVYQLHVREPDCVAAYSTAFDVECTLTDNALIERRLCIPRKLARPFNRDQLAYQNQFPIQSVLFKRSLFERCGGFRPELDLLEDWNLWNRYAALGAFTRVEKTTSLYRSPYERSRKRARRRALRDAYGLAKRHNDEDYQALLQEAKGAHASAM